MRKSKGLRLGIWAFARWQIDYDYLEKLSPKDLEWLRKFTDEVYLARTRCELLDDDQRKAARRAFWYNRHDVMSRGTPEDLDSDAAPVPGRRGRRKRS